jgi:hypothetical protein
MLKKAIVVTLLLGASAPLFAGTPVLDQREANQRARIVDGVRSGELTRPETRRLVRGERRLHRQERRAKADGKVTARERARLQRNAGQMSRRIHRQKHDRQRR